MINRKTNKNAGQIFLEELTGQGPKRKKRAVGQTILIPVLAVFTGLILGAIFILLTTVEVYTAFGKSFLDGLRVVLGHHSFCLFLLV